MKTYHIDRWGIKFHIRVEDEIMEKVYDQGLMVEHHMLDWIEKNVPRGGTWVDVGANIGNHTLPFAIWCDHVLAIEPMPENFDLLCQNTRHLHRVMPVRVGIGDKPAWVGAHLGGGGYNCQWILGEGGPPRIQVVRLDDLIPEDRDIRLLKLDVEGMEWPCLMGSEQTINRCHPELFIEIWAADMLERITVWLRKRGYTLIERWNEAPTYHFSASGRYPVTYRPPVT